MEKVKIDKNGQQYEIGPLTGEAVAIFFCRTCALKMYEPNKGFDYRCAACHEKAEGWC
jgi:hypothetical protein